MEGVPASTARKQHVAKRNNSQLDHEVQEASGGNEQSAIGPDLDDKGWQAKRRVSWNASRRDDREAVKSSTDSQ